MVAIFKALFMRKIPSNLIIVAVLLPHQRSEVTYYLTLRLVHNKLGIKFLLSSNPCVRTVLYYGLHRRE